MYSTFLRIVSPSLAAVVNNLLNKKEFFSVPVSTAEFAVMKTACSVCLIFAYCFINHNITSIISVTSLLSQVMPAEFLLVICKK